MLFRIWSNEHNGWWKPRHSGYTSNEEFAGLYNEREAFAILRGSALGSPPGKPNEVAVEVGAGRVGLRFAVELQRGEAGVPT